MRKRILLLISLILLLSIFLGSCIPLHLIFPNNDTESETESESENDTDWTSYDESELDSESETESESENDTDWTSYDESELDSESETESARETEKETFPWDHDIPDDEYLYECADDYEIKEINGKWYIIFDDPSIYPCYYGISGFCPFSERAWVDDVINGRLNRIEKGGVVTFKSDEIGIPIINLYDHYEPVVPHDLMVMDDVNWMGEAVEYRVYSNFPEGYFDYQFYCRFYVCTNDHYLRTFNSYKNKWEQNDPSNYKYYTIANTEKEYHVFEKRSLKDNEYVYNICVFGEYEGHNFYYEIIDNAKPLSEDYLLQLGIKKYEYATDNSEN